MDCAWLLGLSISVSVRIAYIHACTNSAIQPSYIRQLLTITRSTSNRQGLHAHHHNLSLFWPQTSSSLKFCNRSIPQPMLQLFGTNSQKTSVSLLIQPFNFTTTPLAISSAIFYSRLKTKLFKLSYPDSTPAPPHVRTYCNLHGFWPDTETETEMRSLDIMDLIWYSVGE